MFFPIQLGMSSSQLTFTASFFRGVGEKPPTSHVFDEPSIYPSILSARRSAVTNLNPLWSSSSKQKNFDPGIQSSRQWWTGGWRRIFRSIFQALAANQMSSSNKISTNQVSEILPSKLWILWILWYIYIYCIYIYTGWWFGTCFFSAGNNIIPTDEVHHCSEG